VSFDGRKRANSPEEDAILSPKVEARRRRFPFKMVAIEVEKCGKCETAVYEAEGFPAGKAFITR